MATVTEATGFVRYACIKQKLPREIVMLRGTGCKWRRCRFCDYHLDASADIEANYMLNKQVLSYVTGRYKVLEVINSGSFTDLDEKSMRAIIDTCREHAIRQVHIEFHWMDRLQVAPLKERFAGWGIELWAKMGVETFDIPFRKSYLDKGIDTLACSPTPEDIARYADEVNLLMGLPGQSIEGMLEDVKIGLSLFRRVCVNVMTANSAPIQPDQRVILKCRTFVLPAYQDNPRVDILTDNSDWGLGAKLPPGEVARIED